MIFILVILCMYQVLLLKTCFTGKQQSWVLPTVLMLVGFFLWPFIFLQIIRSSHPRYLFPSYSLWHAVVLNLKHGLVLSLAKSIMVHKTLNSCLLCTYSWLFLMWLFFQNYLLLFIEFIVMHMAYLIECALWSFVCTLLYLKFAHQNANMSN